MDSIVINFQILARCATNVQVPLWAAHLCVSLLAAAYAVDRATLRKPERVACFCAFGLHCRILPPPVNAIIKRRRQRTNSP